MSFLNDAITQLETDGVGVFNQNIFASSKASVPVLPSGEPTLQLIATGGSGADYIQNSVRPAFLNPTLQLTTRADKYKVAEDFMFEVLDSLLGIRNRFIASGWYRWIKGLQSEPFDGGFDGKQPTCKFNVIASYNRRG